MIKIILGLISVMLANILLGVSISKLKETFNSKKFADGISKAIFIIIAVLLMYTCSYLNPDIMVGNINGIDVNLIKGMELLFIAGIIMYGYKDLIKLKDIIQLQTEIKEKKEVDKNE